MTGDTLSNRLAIRLLTPFRRFSERTGEGGAMLMMGVPLTTAFTLLDPSPSRIPLNIVCLAVLATVALAIFARHQDGMGHKAMGKLLKKAAKKGRRDDPDYVAGLEWLELPRGAGVEDIRAAVRAVMKRHHSDTGTGGLDMARLVAFRDRMVAHAEAVAGREDGPDAATLLRAYHEHAGRLGAAWGHLFPTERLRDLGHR
jgi:hypothetical protein